MCQLEQNKKLTSTFPGLVYTKEKHNYNTRSARKNLLDIPLCQTFTYGTQSCKYQCIKDWNRFKKENSTENLTYPVVKNILKKNILASYQYFFTFFLLYLFAEPTEKKVQCLYHYYYYYYHYYYYYYLFNSAVKVVSIHEIFVNIIQNLKN